MRPTVRSFLHAGVALFFATAPFSAAVAAPGVADSPAPASDVPTADGQSSNAVVEVRVEGNKRVEREAIIRVLKNGIGKPFDPAATGDDIRALWALNYFSDVQLLTQRLARGIAYVIRVEERPAIRDVRLEGNEELNKDDFKESLDLKPYSILDLEAVRRNEKKIQDKYIEKGYFLSEVTHRLERVKNSGDVDVVFVIKEHAKVLVKEISFVGNAHVTADELKGVMATKEGSFISFITGEGTYREELFQRDLAVIQSAYYDRGFINVKVDKPSIALSADKKYIFINVRLDEGDQYYIGKMDFTGDLLTSKESLRVKMASRETEIFNRSKLAGDIQRITDVYYDQGYAYANVTPVTAVNPEKRLIDLNFEVQKGKQVYIEKIEIVGNSKTRDKVIRREVRIYEGELFSGTGIRVSKDRVTALGFFETVEVTHKPGSDDTHVVVQVEVKEKATGTFQLGFGFSNVENFIFTAQVSQNNFLGWGQTVAASLQLSSLRNLVQVSYFDPYFLDTNYILSGDFYLTQAQYPDFIRTARGGDVTLGYHFFPDANIGDVMATMAYTLEFVSVEPGTSFETQIPLARRFERGKTSSVRFSLTWDRRDNRLFPTKGFMQFGSVEFAPSLLGGSFLFTKYTAFSRFYVPLPLGVVFKTNATVGYLQQLDPTNPLPISELYYLGGINSVRGYQLRTISPTILVGNSNRPDATTSLFYTGGNKQFILNLELEFPIFEKVGIRGVLFYDTGNAWAVNQSFFTDPVTHLPLGLYHSVGFGFRWFSPIGPLRFEWGIPLTKRPTDQPVDFEFTIGNFF